jgi:hypothetical protein
MSALVLLGTTTHGLTSTVYTFTPDAGVADSNVQDTPQSWRVRLWSPQPFHVAVGADATTNDCPVAGGYEGLTIALPPGESLSVVKQSSADDSTIFFARVKHAS